MGAFRGFRPNGREVRWSDWSGGLRLSVDPSVLAPNEFPDCQNMVFDRGSGKPRTLPTIARIATATDPVRGLWWSRAFGLLLVAAGAKLYSLNGNGSALIDLGTLSGGRTPRFVDWGTESERRVFVASGGGLQVCDPRTAGSLATLVPSGTDLPSITADGVLVHGGRLLTHSAADDRLWWSGVGDPANWKTADRDLPGGGVDYHTDADALTLEVGYKRSGDILSVLPSGRDLLVLRDDGGLFRLMGAYPNWDLVTVADGLRPASRDAVVSSQDSAVFLDRDRGVVSTQWVQTWGDLSVDDARGARVNPVMAGTSTEGARIWTIPSRGEVWVAPSGGAETYVWNLSLNAWTRVNLGLPITGISDGGGRVFLSIGGDLCEMGDAMTPAFIAPTCYLTLRPERATSPFLRLDALSFRYEIGETTSATVSVGKHVLPVPQGGRMVRRLCDKSESLSPGIFATGGYLRVESMGVMVGDQ